jgi:hypothetical protein
MVDQLHAEGRAGQFECLIWESSLCFWLLRDGDGIEAKRRLQPLIAAWRKTFDSNDPWIALLEMYDACADVYVASAQSEKTDREASLARAEAAAARLPKMTFATSALLKRVRQIAAE